MLDLDTELPHPLKNAPKIDSERDIPDLCKSLFLTKERFLSIIWIIAGLILTGSLGCIAWAMTTNSSIIELKSTQAIHNSRLDYLNNEINGKLDVLIGQKNKGN